jgi:hypothetical protein
VTPPLVATAPVTIYDPTTRPASFLALEVVVFTWAALTLRHALRADARGDRAARITWLTIVIYGIAMEAISYLLVQNFVHGQFTVMLWDRQLPLYVVAVYPVLLYTGIAAARALRLPRAIEPIASGLFILALDVPFDLAGPPSGWWIWFGGDPNTAVRWHGVPVTSFYWHLAFGAALAAVTRAASAKRRPPAILAPVLASLTIVIGVIAFLPMHALAALGIGHGTFVGVAIAAAAAATAVALAARGRYHPEL